MKKTLVMLAAVSLLVISAGCKEAAAPETTTETTTSTTTETPAAETTGTVEVEVNQ